MTNSIVFTPIIVRFQIQATKQTHLIMNFYVFFHANKIVHLNQVLLVFQQTHMNQLLPSLSQLVLEKPVRTFYYISSLPKYVQRLSHDPFLQFLGDVSPLYAKFFLYLLIFFAPFVTPEQRHASTWGFESRVTEHLSPRTDFPQDFTCEAINPHKWGKFEPVSHNLHTYQLNIHHSCRVPRT